MLLPYRQSPQSRRDFPILAANLFDGTPAPVRGSTAQHGKSIHNKH
jgi:hypothetical protein